MLGMEKRYCGNLIDALLLSGRLDYTVVEDPHAQKWLLDRVPHVIEQAWTGADRGKFKPIIDAISVSMKLGLLPDHNGLTTRPAAVTYTQLKVFLKAQGYMAALEKSSPLPAPPSRAVASSSLTPTTSPYSSPSVIQVAPSLSLGV
jgi:hypothetical protein